MRALLLTLVLVVTTASAAAAAPGDRDRSFGGDGLVRIPRLADPVDIAVQPNGKILVLGVHNFSAVVARLLPSGHLDPAYGKGGIAGPVFSYGSRWPGANLAVDLRGRAVVESAQEGFRRHPSWVLVVSRFTRSGHLDRTFGGDGFAVTRFRALEQGGFARLIPRYSGDVAIQGKRILAGGYIDLQGEWMAVVGVRPNGRLDRTFAGGDGRILRGVCCEEIGSELTVTDGGRILVGGTSTLLRLGSDGALDRAFSGDGRVRLPVRLGSPAVAAYGERAVVAGTAPSGHWRIVRYTPSGRLDRTFGGDGVVVTRLRCRDEVGGAAFQADGNLVIGGAVATCGSPNALRVALARYEWNGRLDQSFGTNGLVKGRYRAGANEMALQPNGKIVLSLGEEFPSADGGRHSVARYLAA